MIQVYSYQEYITESITSITSISSNVYLVPLRLINLLQLLQLLEPLLGSLHALLCQKLQRLSILLALLDQLVALGLQRAQNGLHTPLVIQDRERQLHGSCFGPYHLRSTLGHLRLSTNWSRSGCLCTRDV